MPLELGSILKERYRIESQLGKGGMGTVYLAYDQTLELQVAVKENLSPSPESKRQFRREAILLAGLRHPNLPRVSDHFILGDHQYLVMDYVEGEDLLALVKKRTPNVDEILAWADAICDALSYLHTRDPPVIHRDIKPANIKLQPDGKVMLVDFGIAKEADLATTTTGARGLTPGFSPPEQYGLQRTDARSDQYALAATLYALLTGQPPTDSFERLMDREPLKSARELKPNIPQAIDTTITRALSLKQEDRFPEIVTFRQALQGLVEEETIREDAVPEIPTEVERAFRLNWVKERAGALEKEESWEEALATWRHYLALEPDDPDFAKTEIERIQATLHKVGEPEQADTEMEVRRVGVFAPAPQATTPKVAFPPDLPKLLARVTGGVQRYFKQWRRPWLWGGIATIVIGSFALLFTRPQFQSFFGSSVNTTTIPSTTMSVSIATSTTSLIGVATAAPGTASEGIEPTQSLRYTETQTPEPTKRLPTPTQRASVQSMTLRGHTNTVWSVAWSPDGTMLASGSEDQTARIWDASSGAEIKILELNREVESVSWSPDSTQLVTPGWSGKISIWDIDDAQVTRLLYAEVWSYRSSWSPDGTMIVSIKRASVDFLSLSSGRSYFSIETSEISDFKWSPDSSRVATGHQGSVRIWDAETGEEITTLKPQPAIQGQCHIAWSPDNTQLFTGCGSRYYLWNVINGEEIWSFTSSSVSCAAWSPYDSMIAVGNHDGGIKILDAETGERLHSLAGHASVVHSVDWSPDATKLASGSADKTIRVWQFP